MSRVCELTGIHHNYGNKVSHSNIKTRTRWNANLRDKKYEIPELKQIVTLMLSTRAIRTIDKYGNISAAIMKAKDSNLSARLMKIKRGIYKARVKAAASGQPGAPAKLAKAPKAPKVAAAPAAAKAPKAAKAKAAAKKTK